MALKPCRECKKKVSTEAATCPNCGVPNPTSKKKINFSISKKSIWAHCSNDNCKDYTQMFTIPSSALDKRECKTCESNLMKARYENGKPVMPSTIEYETNNRIAEDRRRKDESRKATEDARRNAQSKTTKEEESSWGKFMDGNLDLKTAFWGYGFFGSIVVGLVCGFLAEAFSPFFILVYTIALVVIIIGLWLCASTYKKQMAQKKASELWGVLTHIYCVVAALGLANFIKDFI